MPQEKYLECGKITNTHGLSGTLTVESWCDTPEVMLGLKTLYYKKKDEYLSLEVTSASLHKGRVLMNFYGIDSIEEAQQLKNRTVFADRDDLPLDDDRVFVADIIGLPVFDERDGKPLGVLTELIESPASDIFAVTTPDGREVLVPAVEEFIGHMDESGVYLKPIPGMFDEAGEEIGGDEV